MSDSLAWTIGATSLTVLSVLLAWGTGVSSALVAGGVTLGVVGGLWWVWRREQPARPSPISEYLAVGYGWSFYSSLLIDLESVGERWVDWLVMLPPVSVIPLVIGSVLRDPSGRRSLVLHRLAAAVLIASAGFLLITVLAVVVAPVPLLGAALHLVATRFYARQPST